MDFFFGFGILSIGVNSCHLLVLLHLPGFIQRFARREKYPSILREEYREKHPSKITSVLGTM